LQSKNRTLVEQIIRQLNTRDPHMQELCHPEIEWHWPAATPGASLFRGHAELERGLFSAASWLATGRARSTRCRARPTRTESA
jgi:hypothetical protein